MRRRAGRLAVILATALLCIAPLPILAQAIDCPALVQKAMDSLQASCRDLAANNACYGHSRVDTRLVDAAAPLAFLQPADRIALAEISAIHTTAADPALRQWGIAALNIQPAAASAGATILLLGDVWLEEAAPPEQTAAPMQTFTFRAGFDQLPCDQAPSALVVYSPPGAPVELSINGVAARVASLVTFQWQSANGLTATILGGQLEIVGGRTVQTGETLAGVMDNSGKILFWSAPRPASAAEAQVAEVARAALGKITSLDVTAVQPALAPAAAPGCQNLTHAVAPGENLFRISLRYGVAVQAIARANGITDVNRIYVGQQLVIPCGVDSGLSSAAPPADGPAPAADAPADAPANPPASPPTAAPPCVVIPPSIIGNPPTIICQNG